MEFPSGSGLPNFERSWQNTRYDKIDNLFLKDRFEGKDFIIAGAGPSIGRFPQKFRDDKIVVSLCGAHERVRGDLFIPDSTPAGWNGMKELIRTGDQVLMPYGLFQKDFADHLRNLPGYKFEFFSYVTAPARNLKWYHEEPPYPIHWSIDPKTLRPLNTGPQTGPCAVTMAIIMGAKNIYLIGIDGYLDLLKENKPIYLNEFATSHYESSISGSKLKADQHLETRRLRDQADRYLFSEIRRYCEKNQIGIYLLNEDSHLRNVISLAPPELRV